MKSFLLAVAACLSTACGVAQTISVTANGVSLANDGEMRLALDDLVVITVTFGAGQQAKDMLNSIDGKFCAAGKNTAIKTGAPTRLFYFQNGMPRQFGPGVGSARQNVFKYTFNPQKLTGCRDAGFYLLFQFRNNRAMPQKLFRFYVAAEKRDRKQYNQNQSQQQVKF